MCFVVACAHSGLSPVRERPCWANKVKAEKQRKGRVKSEKSFLHTPLSVRQLIMYVHARLRAALLQCFSLSISICANAL